MLRSDAHWVVAIETVCYVPGLNAYTHNLHLYGHHGEAFAYWD
ncbi:MAG: hypothetical protein NZ550_00685 [Fimbriimonadales bacterium]|nr:hypothetical protein [Fimbriimonadales bacterium]MDW8052658.1 hypothetical protein [Armatimonadota bacterium]